MPKVIVIYDSKTGLTEVMAKEVINGVRRMKGVEVELLKAGTPFSIFQFEEADAIIFGSPTRYADITMEMRSIVESAKWLTKTSRLNLSGKIGGIFGSYVWDGGVIIKKLADEMKALGITIVEPAVSAIDKKTVSGTRIEEESLQQCRELGETIALRLVA
jgi:flavorubredoxin